MGESIPVREVSVWEGYFRSGIPAITSVELPCFHDCGVSKYLRAASLNKMLKAGYFYHLSGDSCISDKISERLALGTYFYLAIGL